MATANITVNDVVVVEGNGGGKTVTFTVTRSNNSGTFTLDYATVNGTALAGSDYVARSGKLSFFAGGGLSQTVTVTVNGDWTIEGNETFNLKLSNLQSTAGTAAITDATGKATITNDDVMANVTVSDVSVTEGDSGTKLMNFTVTRSTNIGAFGLDFTTVDGTATAANGDYTARWGQLYFTSNGPLTQTVSVTVKGDTVLEGTETMSLKLSNLAISSGNAQITDATGVGTIVNDDAVSATVSVSDATITEGNLGTSLLSFVVTRTANTGAFTIDYATTDGTATVAGLDYVAKSGTLSFAAGGPLSQTVTVAVNGNTIAENDETIGLNLSRLVNTNGTATIADATAVGNILNDDAGPLGTTIVSNAAELRAALTAATGGETIYLNSGNYGDFSINNIDPASEVKVTAAPGASPVFGQLTLQYSSNLAFSNFEVDNSNIASENEYCVIIQGSQHIQLNQLDIHGLLSGTSWDDPRGVRILQSSDVLLDSSTLHELYVGAAVESSTAVAIVNSHLTTLREGMNIIESNKVLIDHNLITDISPKGADHSDAIQVFTGTTYAASNDLTISNNALLKGNGDYMHGIFVTSQRVAEGIFHSNILIENNVYSGIAAHGISVNGVNDAIVRGNTVADAPGAPWDAWIEAGNADNVTVENNIYMAQYYDGSPNVRWINNVDAHDAGALDATHLASLLVNPNNIASTDPNDFAVKAGSLAAQLGAGADIVALQTPEAAGYYSALLDQLFAGASLNNIV